MWRSTGAAYELARQTKFAEYLYISAFALSFSRTLVFPHSRINILLLLWDTCPGQFTAYVPPFPTYGNGHVGAPPSDIVPVIRDLESKTFLLCSRPFPSGVASHVPSTVNAYGFCACVGVFVVHTRL